MEQHLHDPEAAQEVMEKISIDMMMVGGRKILMMVDNSSTYVHLHTFRVSPSMEMVILAMKSWFVEIGFPKQIRSDGEKIFTSKEMYDFYEEVNIVHELCSSENLTSNGCAECHVALTKDVIHRAELGGGLHRLCGEAWNY